jgi:hypothetical protein
MTFALLFALVGTATGDIVANLTMCIPLEFVWDPTIKGGHCFDQNVYWPWGSLPNILINIAMILLPISAIWKVQLS